MKDSVKKPVRDLKLSSDSLALRPLRSKAVVNRHQKSHLGLRTSLRYTLLAMLFSGLHIPYNISRSLLD